MTFVSGDYHYEKVDGNAIITNYTGSNSIVEIPSRLEGYTVTKIGDKVFSGCRSLKTVTISDSVTSIGDQAFYQCTNLDSVEMGKGLASFSVISIGAYAFYYCYNMKKLTIKCGVISIGEGAFGFCSYLPSVIIPAGTTSIGDYAFFSCGSLTSVTIPGSVTQIGNQAFNYCTHLRSVNIENGVTSISWGSFANCTGLEDFTIPDSVTSIGSMAFAGCTGLNIIYAYPKTAPQTVSDAFLGVEAILYIPRSKARGYDVAPWTQFTQLYFTTLNGDATIAGCVGAKGIFTIPTTIDGNKVTSIGYGAFVNCTDLESVTIPNSVNSIGNLAFYDCRKLRNVTIMNSIVNIGDDAFLNCVGLTSLTIPDSVNRIGNDAFAGCTSLTSVKIGNGVSIIGDGGFYSCWRLNTIYAYPKTAPKTGNDVFSEVSSTAILYMPSGATGYDDDVAPWTQFTQLYFTTLNGNVTITRCVGAKGNFAIPVAIDGDKVTNIGDSSFVDCTWLTSVTIPDSVTNIGRDAFANCTGLTSVTIGNGVTNIGDGAFAGCMGLYTINIYPQIAPQKTASNVFTGVSSTAILYIPSGTNGYAAAPWTQFTQLYFTALGGAATITNYKGLGFSVDIPRRIGGNKVTNIGDSAFANCTGLAVVTIPNSVTIIGNGAFAGCTELRWLTIPDSVTIIGHDACTSCTCLAMVKIGNSVTNIGDGAFAGCTGLKNIYAYPEIAPQKTASNAFTGVYAIFYIPSGAANSYNAVPWNQFTIFAYTVINGNATITAYKGPGGNVVIPQTIEGSKVTSIGSLVFLNCTGITNLIIPDSMINIDDGAFQGCIGLESVTIPGGVSSIGGAALAGCAGLKTIYAYPEIAPKTASNAFSGVSSTTVLYIPSGAVGYDVVPWTQFKR